MKRFAHIIICLAIAATTLVAAPSFAATATASLQVSVTIRPWMKFSAEQNIQTFQVTREDITRGFIDLTNAATVNLKTNEQKEILINARHDGPTAVQLKTSTEPTFANQTGLVNLGRQQAGQAVTRNIDCRVMLAADMQEGIYPLNLTLAPQTF